MVDEDDYPKEDDGLPGTAVCLALVVSMPLWLPVALVFGMLSWLWRNGR